MSAASYLQEDDPEKCAWQEYAPGEKPISRLERKNHVHSRTCLLSLFIVSTITRLMMAPKKHHTDITYR